MATMIVLTVYNTESSEAHGKEVLVNADRIVEWAPYQTYSRKEKYTRGRTEGGYEDYQESLEQIARKIDRAQELVASYYQPKTERH